MRGRGGEETRDGYAYLRVRRRENEIRKIGKDDKRGRTTADERDSWFGTLKPTYGMHGFKKGEAMTDGVTKGSHEGVVSPLLKREMKDLRRGRR